MPICLPPVNGRVTLLCMREISPYEGQLDKLNGRTCLARVVSVDTDNRLLTVNTLGNKMFGTDDLYLPNVKIGHIAWHPNGTYGVYIPQIGEYVLIMFINSEPISMCSYPLSLTEGGGQLANQTDDLGPGDLGFIGLGTAMGGARIIVRAAGTVEIESTKGCRTYWLPINDTINTVCQNYELEPAAGFVHWTIDSVNGDAVMDLKAYDNNQPTAAVHLQVGTADSGALVDLALGDVDENLDVPTPNLTLQIQSDGTTDLNIAQGKITISMTPDGALTLDLAADANITVGGKALVDVTGDLTQKSGGTFSSDASTAQSLKAPQTAIGDGSTELLDQLAQLIDALGTCQVLTALGPSGPLSGGPTWSQVTAIQSKVKSITGSFA